MSTRNALAFRSALGLFALSFLPLAACTDAGLCARGDIGCECQDDGSCFSGFTCDADNLCQQEADNGGSGGSGGSSGRIWPTPQEPGDPPDVGCDSDDFATLCESFCEAICQNQERFCLDSSCESDACEAGGSVLTICLDECAGSTSCARALCEDQVVASLTCDTFGFEADDFYETLCLESDPACVVSPETGCSATCGTNEGVGAQLVDNGTCEDGRTGAENLCPRGTDCTDCGARPCGETGADCGGHGDCCDYLRNQGALCVDADADGPNGAECRPTCSADDPCPSGEECLATDARGSRSVCVER